MRAFVVILIICSISFSVDAQWTLKKEMSLTAGVFSTDVLGNVYITDGAVLNKYNSMGESVFSYSNAGFGQITYTDVSDPMRLLLFYADFNYLIFLDNSLSSLRDPVSLDQLNLLRADVVCTSQKGGFWVYDGISAQLKNFDSGLSITSESNTLPVKDDDVAVLLREFTDYICLGFTKSGLMVFDKFGGFVYQIPVKIFKSVYINEGYLYYFTAEELVKHNLVTHAEETLALPATDYSQICFSGNDLYLFTGKLLKIYSMVNN